MIHTTGKEALEELYRVHFPGSQTGEVTMEGKEWPRLGALVPNREDWELEGSSINPKYNKQ
jgi:hypothetical protein